MSPSGASVPSSLKPEVGAKGVKILCLSDGEGEGKRGEMVGGDTLCLPGFFIWKKSTGEGVGILPAHQGSARLEI